MSTANMTSVRCVVFDIDDTLYLERQYVHSGFLAVDQWLRERNIEGFFDRGWELFQTGLRRTIFDEALAALGRVADPQIIAGMVEAYRAHSPSLALLPDAAECLGRLHGRVALAAISDGPLASQKAKAAALDLARWCRPIVLTEELGPGFGKPNPAAFRLVEAQIGCRGDQCAYIADNPQKDFQAPRALFWRTIRVRRCGGLHEQLPTTEPVDAELPDLVQLPEILGLGGQ
jgi:putative hydrolase of the HAD superfamily